MKIIKYQFLSCEINRGTEEEPNMEQVFLEKAIECSDDAFESNYALALREAVDGEVTVEDVEEPEAQPTTEQRVTELEEAMELLLSGVTE